MTGMDEGYLDFSGTDLLHPVSLLEVATQIRHDVRRSADLDCSIGIGPNRMLAKLASRLRQAARHLRSAQRLGARLPGRIATQGAARHRPEDRGSSGRARTRRRGAGAGDAPRGELGTLLGREEAIALKRRADGAGGSIVRAAGPPKSVSRETTFPRDVTDRAALDRMLPPPHLARRGTAARRGAAGGRGRAQAAARRLSRPSRDAPRSRRPTALDTELMAAARRLLAPALAAARRPSGRRSGCSGIAATALGQAEAPDLFESAARGKARDVSRAVDAVRATLRLRGDAERPARGPPRPASRRAPRGTPTRFAAGHFFLEQRMATAEGRTIPFTGPEAIDVAVLETFPYRGPRSADRDHHRRVLGGLPLQRTARHREAHARVRPERCLHRAQEPQVLHDELSQRGDLPGARHGPLRRGPAAGPQGEDALGHHGLQRPRRLLHDLHGDATGARSSPCWFRYRAASYQGWRRMPFRQPAATLGPESPRPCVFPCSARILLTACAGGEKAAETTDDAAGRVAPPPPSPERGTAPVPPPAPIRSSPGPSP